MSLMTNPAIYGILGILIGAGTGAYLNNRLNAKNNREEFIFRKKTEYFEKVIESIENNLKLYHNAIEKLETSNKKEIKALIKNLKENRKNFKIAASPIYIDTKRMSEKILRFVYIEKDIFLNFKKAESNPKSMIEKPLKLKETYKFLRESANEIVKEAKRQLYSK